MIRLIDEFIVEIANLLELILYVIGGFLIMMAFVFLLAWIFGTIEQYF